MQQLATGFKDSVQNPKLGVLMSPPKPKRPRTFNVEGVGFLRFYRSGSGCYADAPRVCLASPSAVSEMYTARTNG